MTIVKEFLDCFPFTDVPRTIERDEHLLLGAPLPSPMGRRQAYEPLQAVHFASEYADTGFAPPRGVYECEDIRVEWQIMNFRQPFYHRNTGADELSYQVCGERTVLTEFGSENVAPGEFILIPNGVAHDNFGRRDIHLLFYVPDRLEAQMKSVRSAQLMESPFPGWAAKSLNELVTGKLGGHGTDLAFFPSSEALLLDNAKLHTNRLQVLRPGNAVVGTTWAYRSKRVAIGRHFAPTSAGDHYWRHLDADEVQYQLSGERSLVTQRGLLQISPGDFVRIPKGVAFTSIHAAPNAYLRLAATHAIPQVAKGTKHATELDSGELDRLRAAVTG